MILGFTALADDMTLFNGLVLPGPQANLVWANWLTGTFMMPLFAVLAYRFFPANDEAVLSKHMVAIMARTVNRFPDYELHEFQLLVDRSVERRCK